jgi:hypothetical protein
VASLPASTSMERSVSMDTTESKISSKSRRSNVEIQYDGTRIGNTKETLSLFPLCHGDTMDNHTLFLQLKRSVDLILSAKEAMWDELWERIENRERTHERRELTDLYGWEECDFQIDVARRIFNRLVNRYKESVLYTQLTLLATY